MKRIVVWQRNLAKTSDISGIVKIKKKGEGVFENAKLS